jgi:hypothetical protein
MEYSTESQRQRILCDDARLESAVAQDPRDHAIESLEAEIEVLRLMLASERRISDLLEAQRDQAREALAAADRQFARNLKFALQLVAMSTGSRQ